MKNLLVILMLILCLGCEPSNKISESFREGQTVELKIGGKVIIIRKRGIDAVCVFRGTDGHRHEGIFYYAEFKPTAEQY